MTTRFEVLTGRIITYLFAALCLVLAYINLIKIDTSTRTIVTQIELLAAERKSEIKTLSGNLALLREDMDQHRQWSRSIDSAMVKRESTWIDRTEFIEWCNESKRLNPSLTVPAIEAIKHTHKLIEAGEGTHQ